MYVIDSRDTINFAREHAKRLREDAAPDRKRRSPVAWLRRHTCRCKVEAAPLAHRPA
jgi:hypothetical protein